MNFIWRIILLFKNPQGELGDLYDWNRPTFDGKKILGIFDRLAAEVGILPSTILVRLYPVLDLLFLAFGRTHDLSPRGLEVQLSTVQRRRGGVEHATLVTTTWIQTIARYQPSFATRIHNSNSPQRRQSYKNSAQLQGAPRPADPFVLLSFLGDAASQIEELAAYRGTFQLMEASNWPPV